MTARLIDGKALAASIRASLAARIARAKEAGQPPGLAVVLVGDDPASAVYVRNKIQACEDVGIRSFADRLPASTSEAELLARIDRLNADPAVHGILVQLPLPGHLDAQRVLETIAFDKDVDGLHATNAGLTLMGVSSVYQVLITGILVILAVTVDQLSRKGGR